MTNAADSPSLSTLSVVGNQGLLATTKIQHGVARSPQSGGKSPCSGTCSSEDATGSNVDDQRQTEQRIDFIGTSPAVKKLFSIPLAEQSICVAVHNIDGTLLIDEVVPEDEVEQEPEKRQSHHLLPPSSQSLALALAPDPEDSTTQQVALSLLSKMIQESKQETDGNPLHSHELLIRPPISPSPVREYLEWKFHDMNLLVGSDALIVRPETGDASGVVIRVEEVNKLRRLMELQHIEDNKEEKPVDSLPTPTSTRAEKSYADALLRPSTKPLLTNATTGRKQSMDQADSQHDSLSSPLHLDQVQLQTCIVPTSGPLGGWLTSSTHKGDTASAVTPSHNVNAALSSPKCIVLDAYLDNLMANVPQLALCLQEKGLIQSVKLLDRGDIPTMMMHPHTLDTSRPVETIQAQEDGSTGLFSPEIMDMNATALLRFLKANCTTNNTTYLLRTDTSAPDGNNIQLYDISSISQQRQKKWIWWLATMSYRFALRLRQMESHDVLPMRQRSFRNRQRSLLQATLDLLQDLRDMDGNAHESLVASVREHMADTFLGETGNSNGDLGTSGQQSASESTSAAPSPVMASQRMISPLSASQQPQPQPYAMVTTDALNKAQDHLLLGIKALQPVLEHEKKSCKVSEVTADTAAAGGPRRRKRGESGAKAFSKKMVGPSSAIVSQLFGLNYKVVNVSLRLAEHYLRQYSSSSAMQSLRHASRRMADSISLLEFLSNPENWISRLRLQYTWLWEHCGHFARSFASDDLWRERGHATGDDILYVLRDVNAAFGSTSLPYNFSNLPDPIRARTKGFVSLQNLSALYAPRLGDMSKAKSDESATWEEAKIMLSNQGLIQRDKRQVLVAACICYNRAIAAFQEVSDMADHDPSRNTVVAKSATLLNLLRQRLGDACNETGKVLLASLRTLLSKEDQESYGLADVLLDSAQFWFLEGLEAFENCGDPRNIALLRCNLCQCCKLRANASFSSQAPSDSSSSHAEVCLEKAVSHLQAAHETLGTRETDTLTWDMVSDELAATFLVLAVRRRQSLLGGGATPVLLEALRLSPGKERSIIEPMQKALAIYQQSGNLHQAAAVQYQLALTNSKVWTCQRDEAKTREKLSSAFTQYQSAYSYFASHLIGNEPTFVLLCLDIASLYAAVSGEDCLAKALERCLDTVDAFSPLAIEGAKNSTSWFEKMETLAHSVDDRVFKLLRNLAKINPERWKDSYREALSAKMASQKLEISDPKLRSLQDVYNILLLLRKTI